MSQRDTSVRELRPRGGGGGANLGDLVIVFLTGTLAALRDRLALDGFTDAADLVADLVEISDDYLAHAGGR